MKIKREDIKIESWPRQKQGGMQTGKIEPGIRITHWATGKTAECTVYRSQHANKAEALRLLEEKIK